MSEIVTYNPDLTYDERPKNDFYQTPVELAKAALQYVEGEFEVRPKDITILDPGAGTGSWGKAALQIFGDALFALDAVELDENFIHDLLSIYDVVYEGDFLKRDLPPYNIIMGNPPYGKSAGVSGKFAELFVRRAGELLANGGFIVFLLKATFLHSDERWTDDANTGEIALYNAMPLYRLLPCVQRPSFKDGKDRKTGKAKKGATDATEYSIFIWHKDEYGNWVDGGIRSLNWKENTKRKTKRSKRNEDSKGL